MQMDRGVGGWRVGGCWCKYMSIDLGPKSLCTHYSTSMNVGQGPIWMLLVSAGIIFALKQLSGTCICLCLFHHAEICVSMRGIFQRL